MSGGGEQTAARAGGTGERVTREPLTGRVASMLTAT